MPVLFQSAWRIFFLLAGLQASTSVLWWGLVLAGLLPVPQAWPVTYGHAALLIFGYASMVVSGFILTAAPNWSGKSPWPASRVLALSLTGAAGLLAATVSLIAAAFILTLMACALLAGLIPYLVQPRTFRHILVWIWLALYTGAMATCAAGLYTDQIDLMQFGLYGGLFALLALLVQIAGTILPFFISKAVGSGTAEKQEHLTMAAAIGLFATGVMELAAPGSATTSATAVIAALLNTTLLVRWRVHRTVTNPILAVLPAGYGMVVTGLILHALAPWTGWSLTATLHAYTIGGIGLFSFGMMTRVALGHAGMPIKASPLMQVAYVAVAVAAGLRVLAAVVPALSGEAGTLVPAGLWCTAFILYLAEYTPHLVKARADGRPG